MNSVISKVVPGGPCSGRRIYPGDRLIRINGHVICDVLDYKFYSYDAEVVMQLQSAVGKVKLVRVCKDEGEDLGLEFENYLMDKARGCANRCIFCFVDQLPKGMRDTLYFKDDDARLSFLQGNYITLTNLSERELERIMRLHISPINVSVHATDPDVRRMMLGNKNGGRGYGIMKRLAAAGIVMNCQIVCCPGINDGKVLRKTMEDLALLYPQVASVSVVPVGLTCHRDNLYPLKPFDKKGAEETVRMVEEFGDRCLKKCGSKIFFSSDELYIKAGLPLPEDSWYEGYPQLENGVGMIRLLITEFEENFEDISGPVQSEFTAVTGVSARPYINGLLDKFKERHPETNGAVIAVENDFFGRTINVAGLLTGRDIIKALDKVKPAGRVLIPRNMLRHGEGVFLDDTAVEDIEKRFNVSVRVVEQDGRDLALAFAGR